MSAENEEDKMAKMNAKNEGQNGGRATSEVQPT